MYNANKMNISTPPPHPNNFRIERKQIEFYVLDGQ